MSSPNEYQRKLAALGLAGGGGLQFQASSVAEAKQLLPTIRQLQAELRAIKKEINLDIKTIRLQYQQQRSGAGSGAAAIFTLFGKRKVAGSIRADAKRQLSAQQDKEIASYEQVKATIDNLLIQLDRAKIAVQQYIAENSKGAK